MQSWWAGHKDMTGDKSGDGDKHVKIGKCCENVISGVNVLLWSAASGQCHFKLVDWSCMDLVAFAIFVGATGDALLATLVHAFLHKIVLNVRQGGGS